MPQISTVKIKKEVTNKNRTQRKAQQKKVSYILQIVWIKYSLFDVSQECVHVAEKITVRILTIKGF